MSIAAPDHLIAHNPATGAELARVEITPPETVASVVEHAREAQASWGTRPWSRRRDALRRFHAILARDAEAWAHLLRNEIGKPIGEAMGEVVTTLDALRWTIKNAHHALAEERLSRSWQRLMLVPPARQAWRPIGVIGLIGTWNYPLYLTAPVIADALAMGNAVVWKPSELASLAGERLRHALDEAAFPSGLVGTVVGGPDVGRALIGSRIDKAHFTGGIVAGRRVLTALAERGIPATVELSGYDAAIVLPDAPRPSTVKALAWAAFVGAGQTCAAVKRVYVVGAARPWAEALAEQARSLRVGDPSSDRVDIGPLISEAARDRFDGFIQQAISAGAEVLAGAGPGPIPGPFYRPTVLFAEAENAQPEHLLAGSFGPVILVRGMPDPEAAIAATNASDYGLTASVWGRDRRAAQAVAARIQAGQVSINDAVAPLGHAAAPFGGLKASGYGRTHGILGLRDFAQPQVIHLRRTGGLRPQVFPYNASLMLRGLAIYRRLFHS